MTHAASPLPGRWGPEIKNIKRKISKAPTSIPSQQQACEVHMRGFGAFQQSQMKRGDPRWHELFRHLRSALDVMEQIVYRPIVDPPPAPAVKVSDKAER